MTQTTTPPAKPITARIRERIGRTLMDATWAGLAKAGALPNARPARYGVERIEDIPYASSAEHHLLDVYRPIDRPREATLPVVLYVHGGAFRILSKDTHWVMGIAFARRGACVFNVNYRLAPQHPYPAAIEDVCAALAWVHQNAARFGGDPTKLVLAGESAGANLVSSLAIATSWPRPEPWARRLWDLGIRPRVAMPACGILQVTDVERFHRRRPLSPFIQDRLLEVERAYLGEVPPEVSRDLADPLVFLERAADEGSAPPRPLPAFFSGVGTADPLLDDTRRLKAALDRLGVANQVDYYPREPHAFHAFAWRPNARAFWRRTASFLDEHLS